MKQDTLKITTGAMFVAIFALFIIINRQTGGMFQGIVLFLLPIPMVAYSAKFGFKAGLPVCVAMAIMSFFFGTPTFIFYAFTATLTGLVFGTCIQKKVDGTKTLFIVMGMSILAEIANMVIFSLFFSYDIHAEAEEFRVIFMEAIQNAVNMSGNPQGEQMLQLYDQMLTPSFMIRMVILSTVMAGIFQGFVTYELSLLILNKLRFQIARPRSLFSYTPPRWLSFIAVDLYIAYFFAGMIKSEQIQSVLQTVGICGYMYLIFFGFLQVVWYFKQKNPRSKFMGYLAATALLMVFNLALMVFGIYYCLNHDGKQSKVYLDKLEEEKKKSSLAYRPESQPVKKQGPKKGSMAYKANLAMLGNFEDSENKDLPASVDEEAAPTDPAE